MPIKTRILFIDYLNSVIEKFGSSPIYDTVRKEIGRIKDEINIINTSK